MDSPEPTIRLEHDGLRPTVLVQGPLDLTGAGAVRPVLMESLLNSNSVMIDLGGLTRLDLSGLQLLCSAHRTAVTRGAALTLGRVPDWVRELIVIAGFHPSLSTCPYRKGADCLWNSREAQ